MNVFPRAAAFVVAAACLPLASCASLRQAGKSSASAVRKSTSAAVSTIAAIPRPKLPSLPSLSMASLLPGRRVKVVEAREKELREMPTGKELAESYRRERNSGFWVFGGPVDFKEPTLPEPGSELDGSLLPPLTPSLPH